MWITNPGHPQGTVSALPSMLPLQFRDNPALSRLWLPKCVRPIASYLHQALEERFGALRFRSQNPSKSEANF